MPADTSARYYQWFMADTIPSNRTVAYEWWPDGEFASSLTLGTLWFKVRDTPDDMWSAGRRIGGEGETPWVVAQKFARNEGFSVEVAVH